MWFYFAIFFFIVFFGAAYDYKLKPQSRWLFLALWFVLVVVAGFRGELVDNDYGNYVTAITKGWGVTEPSFYQISYICYDLLGSVKLVFVVYALLSVTLLFAALRRLSPNFFLTLLIYYSVSYVTHDLNQIRAGVGVGFALLALKPWIENRMWKTFGYLLLATYFHFSFGIFFLLYFILKDSKKHLWLYLALVPLSYVLHMAGINILSLLMMVPIPYVQKMASGYSQWGIDMVASVNVFSILVCIKIFLISVLAIYARQLGNLYTGFYLYLKMYILGLVMLVFMATLPGAAFRIAELLWIGECLLLTMLPALFRPRWLAVSLVILLCTYWMWLNYVSSDFVRPYYFDFSL